MPLEMFVYDIFSIQVVACIIWSLWNLITKYKGVLEWYIVCQGIVYNIAFSNKWGLTQTSKRDCSLFVPIYC